MSAEFATVGKEGGPGSAPGTTIWRVENKECVLVDSQFHGQFYTGDSYVCLFTRSRPKSSALDHDIHFWLGAESSQDEIGIAAYKTVELDDTLGGAPVQHREVQGHETSQFVSQFKNGVTYLDGGVDSGFNHVVRDAYEPRLLHLKGKRTVRCRQVAVTAGSLNKGDVFILDLGLRVFQWNGSEANRWEKTKGLQMVNFIKDEERGGRAELVFLEEDDEGKDAEDFWAALGGKGEVAPADGDDAQAEAQGDVALLKVSDANGEMEVTKIEERPLKQGMLDTNDVFILDCVSEVFVWIGKGSTAEEKKAGMRHGQEYISNEGRPSWTPVTRVIEGGETVLFKEKFSDWKVAGALLPGMPPAIAGRGVAGSIEQKEIDYKAIFEAQKAAEGGTVLDPEGTVEMWRIENFQKVPIAADTHGQFHAGDSYVILYTWPGSSKEKPIIYFWQGRDSSTDEKGASALFAQELDTAMGGTPVQVRVVQGKEPNDFLSLFKGKMVVHEGGVASGFKNKNDTDSFDTDGISLFHVRGTSALNTRAVQVAEKAASLNSADAFILLTADKVTLWIGSGANDDERTYGASIAEVLKQDREMETVEEGSEPDAFWEAIGGKGEYAATPELRDSPREPRLFEVSDATGQLVVEEIFDFAQDDLHDDNVHLLDTYTTVFVWVGSQASKRERETALEVAGNYVKAATDGRSADTSIIRVEAGSEPPMFTCHFLGWNAEKAALFVDPYEAKMKKVREEKAAAAAAAGEPAPEEEAPKPQDAADAAPPASGYADPASKKYTYEELLERPADCDPTNREQYLADDEFEKVMGMDRAAFNGLAKWRQANKKKEVNLF